ncbi:MAG: pirin family protein [Gammaproteobacteria bacterium]|nr:pirin family protein [Gammaproteobacteria bacterium]
MLRLLQRVTAAQRTADGAGVTLYRSLGQSQFARLDPLLMLDEFSSERADEYIAGFPAHPHRGFQTVTYMLEGHMLHEDHLGNRGHLKSGGVQWMTAGRGIIHSEMPQQESGLMRGFQLWINLPARAKMCPAGYEDIEASRIPLAEIPRGRVKVIAGDFVDASQAVPLQVTGPVVGVSTQPIFFDVDLQSMAEFRYRLPAGHNVYLYVFEGELAARADSSLPAGLVRRQGGVLGPGDEVLLTAGSAGARFLLLAAAPIGEPVVQHGPFVMTTRAEIERAIADYQSGRLTAQV